MSPYSLGVYGGKRKERIWASPNGRCTSAPANNGFGEVGESVPPSQSLSITDNKEAAAACVEMKPTARDSQPSALADLGVRLWFTQQTRRLQIGMQSD